MTANENEKWIPANHPALQYMGRIDFDDPANPFMVYPCSYVKLRFTGSFIRADVTNYRTYWDSYIGVIVDGTQSKFPLQPRGRQELTLAEGLEAGWHEVLLFKRMDACHQLTFHGFAVEAGAQIALPAPLPERRMEVYGDSVSAGEVSEAVEYCGMVDPPHNGEYSNSYYSYPWYTARMLNAQLHDVAQGGIALLDGTGYGPPGMEHVYDKLRYSQDNPPVKQWDFARFTPHVVVVAIGQNDNHPDDYMCDHYDHPKAVHWRERYAAFVRRLREIYPKATIILATTILSHSENWDRSIDAVCRSLNDPRIHHFLYSNNGCGTNGHIRKPEAEKMAQELTAFINSLGEEIWED